MSIRPIDLVALPRLMKEAAAATYLGVSRSTLRKLELPRRTCGALRLYDRRDLDEWADNLPQEGDDSCDDIFGVSL